MPKTERNSESSTQSSTYFKFENYQNYFSQIVRQLLDEECMVDVTLCANGQRIQAHRLVLCTCSELIADICSQVNDEHITIILDDIDPNDVRSIVEYLYNGQVRTPAENINNFLAAAHTLKIQSLMEVDVPTVDERADVCEDDQMDEDFYQDDDDDSSDKIGVEGFQVLKSEDKDEGYENGSSDQKGRKRRKSVCKKEYTEEMLSNAIDDIKAGNSLLDAAEKFHIPRSTLYMRAKILGIVLSHHNRDYTADDMKAAIEAVIAGSSLQNAADTYGIPKTVLWRRIQKEGHVYRTENRRSYDAEQREAAIKALERGEALTKVAHEYQIPKTTLFRDKVRLVDEGKIPLSEWKRRKSYIEGEKRMQLEKAVAACKKGAMSQAAASMHFNIPKTTIWRRLQRDAAEGLGMDDKRSKKGQVFLKSEVGTKVEDLTDAGFEVYCDEDSEMGIVYIDDPMAEGQNVIMLPDNSTNEISLPNTQLVVMQGSEDNYIDLELDESSTFDAKS